MKNLLSSLLIVVLSMTSAFGQTQEALTNDAKKVILYPDGTWKYVENKSQTGTSENDITIFIT